MIWTKASIVRNKQNVLLKNAIRIFIGILIIYIIFILSFTQGIATLHKDMFKEEIETIVNKNAENSRSAIISTLFLYNDVLIIKDKYHLVINKHNNHYQTIPISTMFNKIILLANIPLILILLIVFFIAMYFSTIKRKQHQVYLEQINHQASLLLAAFNITPPAIENQNTLSSLNLSMTLLLEKITTYKHETELGLFQDKLTGLTDRHAYLSHLSDQLEVAEQQKQKRALLFIDLDGFKKVNDSFGHSFGDEILIQVAERLKTTVRNQSLSSINRTTLLEQNLARLGGDEFSIFIEDLTDPSLAVRVSESILHEIERDFTLGNKLVKIGASIGIAIYPDSASSAHALLQMADVAMYRAKTDGRGIFRVYSADMGNKMRRHHYLLEEMRLALTSQNFSLSYQPIVHVTDCSIDYFESLVRWNHPVEGVITPTEFIPIAEESNLILELGDWILFEACRQMSAWFDAGMRKVRMSINLSGVQLKHRTIHPWIMDTLNKIGLPPTSIMIEITESCFIEATDKTIQQLELLRQEGILIAIDDFGTGFSSLSTLAELPVDVIKIDKLFIDQANENKKYYNILSSISELGEKLGLKIVAEGVEYTEQFELVRKLGIQCVQGYIVSRPQTSRNVGNKVLKENQNLIAATGTSTWRPNDTNPPSYLQ